MDVKAGLKMSKAISVIENAMANAAVLYPGGFIPRSEIPRFTGGLYSVGYLANCDAFKNGPEGSFRIGRQRVYPIESVKNWLIARIEVA